ncbi:MAG: serine hydrolase domain-containing protein [Pseudomonadota bacterium]
MTSPMITGITVPEFDAVAETFAEAFEQDLELGAGFAVWLDGELVVNLMGGFADQAKTKPWTEQTIVPVYSVSKGVSALIIARLVDQGLVDYDAPLAQYWPEFGAYGKDTVTVGEALSHQAGVPGFVEPIDPDLWLDPPALSARLAQEPPQWTPGEGSGYHPLTWGYIAGELVQRVAGRSLGTLLREDICGPLGIDFQIGTPKADHGRIAELKRPTALPNLGKLTDTRRSAFLTKWAAPNRGGALWREIEIPSANGHGTAAAVARLYSAFAHGGQIGSKRLFSEAVYAALARSRCLGEDRVLPFTLSFGAGVMRNSHLAFGPNPNTLGHSGWGGSVAFGDPDRGLSVAYVMNQQSNILLDDPRPARLIASVYGCL